MKKQNYLLILLLLLILLCSIFFLASCDGNDHTHNYSTEWAKDGSYHWQACSGCEEIRNKAEHDWNPGVVILQPTETSEGTRTYTCDTCRYTRAESIPMLGAHEHTFSESWSTNETHHWYAATCEHAGEVKDKSPHDYSNGICSVCGKEDDGIHPSVSTDILTEEEWRECFNYFADQNANYTVQRYSATENTRHNATFFVDGEKYQKHAISADTYCIKIYDSSFLEVYKDMTSTYYGIVSSFTHDGDGDFLTYSELAEHYSDFEYEPINGVYAYHVEEDGYIFILDVKIIDKKLHSIAFIDGGMHLIYEFSNYGTTTVELPELEVDENYIYEKNEDSTWKIAKCIVAEPNVVIPSTYKDIAVTVIGKNAFNSNRTITNLTIPSSIKMIEEQAFSSSSVTTVDIAEGVTHIGMGAFRYSRLEEISLPNSIEFIGNEAFNSNVALVYNTKNNINYLGNTINPYVYAYGLTDCWDYTLTSVTLDANCKIVAQYAFSGQYLNEINVESENKYFSAYNGVLFNRDQTELLATPRAATGEYIVPSSVLKIADYAFSSSSFSAVILPDSIEYIGKGAFQYSNITRITIGSLVSRIEESTFEDCRQLVSVTIGDNVGIIARDAFSGCSSLKDVVFSNKGNLETIETWAFAECTSLVTLILPEGLETLQSNFARESHNLKYLSVPNSLINVDESAFFYLYGLEYNMSNQVAYIGNSENPYLIADDWKGYGQYRHIVIEDSCKFISSIAFEYDSYVESIVLGKSIVNIAGDAFRGCYGIKEVYNLSKLELKLGSDEHGEIAKYAVTIHEDLNESSILGQTDDGFKYYIKDNTCYVYDYIGEASNITLPTAINSIECVIIANAFQNNTEIVSVSIPTVIGMGIGVFQNCTNLQFVTIEGDWLIIPEETFSGCISLKNISLSQTITTIGENAFLNCTSLREFRIPKSVKNIDENAFYGCTSLLLINNDSSLVLTLGDESHGYVAYYAKEIVLQNAESTVFYKDSLGLLYYLEDDSYVLYGYDGTATDLVLPQTINNKSYIIADGAFANNKILKTIVMQSGIKTINQSFFAGCSNLERIALPNTIETIGEKAFYSLAALQSITFSDDGVLDSIGNEAFYRCSSLNSITIPNTVKSIGDDAFHGCSSLHSVIFEENSTIQKIGDKAFFMCHSLERVLLPDSIIDIGWYCFYECYSMKQVKLPSSITYISMYMFENCCSLVEIVVPNSVKEIRFAAFRDCHNLRKITIGSGVLSYGEDCFYDCFRLTEVINLSATSFPGKCMDVNRTYESVHLYNVDDGQNRFTITDEGFVFYYVGEDYYLVGYEGSQGDIILPQNFAGNKYIIAPFAFAEDMWNDCCGGITSIEIPDNSVDYIESGAFSSCKQLTTITLGDGIKNIYDSAFNGCSELETIIIPNGVQYISYSTFVDCNNLLEIYIPDSIINISYYSFVDCISLAKINYSGTIEEWENIVKEEPWYSGCPIEEIVCSNGTITS